LVVRNTLLATLSTRFCRAMLHRSLVGVPDTVKMCREFALLGQYEAAGAYISTAISQIERYACTHSYKCVCMCVCGGVWCLLQHASPISVNINVT
jgi:hypothetical protein